MYIDSLTIAAAVVFLVALAAFIRFCVVKICGVTQRKRRRDAAGGEACS